MAIYSGSGYAIYTGNYWGQVREGEMRYLETGGSTFRGARRLAPR